VASERVRYVGATELDSVQRISRRWKISCDLAVALHRLDESAQSRWSPLLDAARRLRLPTLPFEFPGLYIISGHRSPADNVAAGGAVQSKHLRCPADAADLRLGNVSACLTTPAIWEWLGAIWQAQGGRNPSSIVGPAPCPGWTADLNHFELLSL